MADPAFVNCSAGQWTKIATSITAGRLHIVSNAPRLYSQTYRATGNPAPTVLEGEGVPFDSMLDISSSTPIDVYVWCVEKAGRVRLDT